MSQESYETLCHSIDNMADWKAAVVCAVCASKVVPVIVGLGLPATWSLVEECIIFAWGYSAHHVNIQQGRDFVERLESTPEWQCEDNSFMPFSVTEALGFIKLAVLALTDPSLAKENAKGVFDALIGMASSYEYSSSKFPFYSTSTECHIRLQASEEESQVRIVRILDESNMASQHANALLRQEAERITDLFRMSLPMVCYHHLTSR